MESTDTAPQSDVRIPKKGLIIGSVSIILLVTLFILWQTGALNNALSYIIPTQLIVTVNDANANTPITGAQVTLQGKNATTGADGVAKITNLRAKTSTMAITAEDYKPVQQNVALKLGTNSAVATLKPTIDKVTLNGITKDYVNETIIGGVTVTTPLGSATSNSEGKFTLTNVPVGELTFTLEKSGYNKKTPKVTIAKANTVEFALVPSGRAVFTSNRDGGKRGVYTVTYDGLDLKPLIKRTDDTEDYGALQSYNAKKVAFLSTREKRRKEGAGYEASLYIIDPDGTNLTQLSKEFDVANYRWSQNSKYLTWLSRSSATNTNSNLYIYNVETKQTTKLSDSGSTYYYDFNHKGTMISWVQNIPTNDTTSNGGLFYRDLSKQETKKVDDRNVGSLSFAADDKNLQFSYYDYAEQKSKNYAYAFDSGSKADFTPESDPDPIGTPSPDGKLQAYVDNRDGKNDVFIKNSDGADEKRLTTLGTAMSSLLWDQTNKYILFDSLKSGESAIYIVGTNAASPKKITDILQTSGYY